MAREVKVLKEVEAIDLEVAINAALEDGWVLYANGLVGLANALACLMIRTKPS